MQKILFKPMHHDKPGLVAPQAPQKFPSSASAEDTTVASAWQIDWHCMNHRLSSRIAKTSWQNPAFQCRCGHTCLNLSKCSCVRMLRPHQCLFTAALRLLLTKHSACLEPQRLWTSLLPLLRRRTTAERGTGCKPGHVRIYSHHLRSACGPHGAQVAR